jgi:hypothetical protein
VLAATRNTPIAQSEADLVAAGALEQLGLRAVGGGDELDVVAHRRRPVITKMELAPARLL